MLTKPFSLLQNWKQQLQTQNVDTLQPLIALISMVREKSLLQRRGNIGGLASYLQPDNAIKMILGER